MGKHIFYSVKVLTIESFIILNVCNCSFSLDVASDSVKDTIQILTGINQLLSAKDNAMNPITAALTDALINEDTLASITPTLEDLYEKFFLSSNSTTDSTVENQTMNSSPLNLPPNNLENNVELQNPATESQTVVYEENTNFVTTAEPVTAPVAVEHVILPDELTTVSSKIETNEYLNMLSKITTMFEQTTQKPVVDEEVLEELARNIRTTPENNSTFEKFLVMQNNVCYKIKYGIQSITESDLIVLFMKFLEYEYLKAKESWERIKVTSSRIWDSAIQEPEDHKSVGAKSITNFLRFLDQTRRKLQTSFNILKKPFSLIMKGIKNRLISKPEIKEQDDRNFCEKFNDAERRVRDIVIDLEQKINKKLDVAIDEEKQVLENSKKYPEKIAYFNKETISQDINYLKEKIFNTYIYFKTVAVNQLQKLQGIKETINSALTNE